ncbi:transglutaminase TgpA family protein [Halorussus halophilus]|uniref:transglutaminase TgpA family protein n=1 Tax=Halorussus halophilus TaxID=2650975 RepID=UPI001CE43976|nr:transglutaminaseTgpA domain-containing protein [Halorussus halophilus]
MSTQSKSDTVRDKLNLGDVSISYHKLAVASTLVLVATSMQVLFHVTNIVGGTGTLLLIVAATLGIGVVVARKLRPYQASLLAALLLALGLVSYYLAVPSAYLVALSFGKLLNDNLALLTGLSVLRMTSVGTWALGVAPAMVFAPWYLVLRRRYALAVAAGGAALGFFVLTGDAGNVLTLVGTLAAGATLGFGTLARHGGTSAQVDTLAVVLVAMLVLASSVSLVPGGSASPLLPGSGATTPTVEGSLVSNSERVGIVGSIRLSPKVRFTVESDEKAYWRVGAYDRYSGDGWVRTGDASEYYVQPPPPGSSERVQQTYTVEAQRVNAMPAAWKPTRLTSGDVDNTRITSLRGLAPVGALREGEQYTIVSQVPNPGPQQLRNAGSDYPAAVEERYLQLPQSSEDRIRQKTNQITADEDNAYAKAKAIESWLESNKRYDLDVKRPEGTIAESFIFDMKRGYCTYYATSMVTMLRSQGIPARFVVGYTPGQRVSEDEYVVRGLDSHAWVEVYFPDVGWVRFDPTPAGPRQQAEGSQIEQARQSNVSDVDTGGSADGTWTPTTTETTTTDSNETSETDTNSTSNATASNQTVDRGRLDPGGGFGGTVGTSTETNTSTGVGEGDEGGGIPIGPPSKEQAAFGLVVLVGLLAAARRTGVASRIHRAVWLRHQPRRDPETDVKRAFDRLEYLLADRYRERRTGETPREYLADIGDVDERVARVGDCYERVRYAGQVEEDTADEAVSLVDELVGEWRRPLGR